MKRPFLAAAVLAALAACSSQSQNTSGPPSNAVPAQENSSRDAPPHTAPVVRPANPY